LPEADDFLAEPPRALPPLEFYVLTKENEAATKFFNDRTLFCHSVREAFYAGDAAFELAESRSFAVVLQRELDALLGRGWGLLKLKGTAAAGQLYLNFKRFADTTRIREIVALLRRRSAQARFPWIFAIMVEPHGDMSYEVEELRQFDEEAKADEHWLAYIVAPEYAEKDSAERAERYRDDYEILGRQHLLRLREQQGGEIEPELFAPAAALEPEPEPVAEEEPLSEASTDEDGDEGGVAIAPPPPAPPGSEDLSSQLRYAVYIYEDCMTIGEGAWGENARYALGQTPVEWTPECAPAAA
jgi:hypothetical protein